MALKTRLFVMLLAAVICSSVSYAAVIKIPDDHSTIQGGIDAAADGDTVSIDPGTYSGSGNENILVTGKSLYIIGDAGAETTIIDLGGSSDGFDIEYNFETPFDSVVIIGLTIRNGNRAVFIDPVLYQSFGTVKIYDCRFYNNTTAIDKDEFAKKRRPGKDKRASQYDSLFVSNSIFSDNVNGIILYGNSDQGSWGKIDSSTFTGHDQAILTVTSFSTILNVYRSVFDGNNTALKGPFSGYDLEIRNNGVAVYGRCDFISIYDDIYLENCILEGNLDTVFHAGAGTHVVGSDIINNDGELFAGTFSNSEAISALDFENCLISNNGPVTPLRGHLSFDSVTYTYNDGLIFDHFFGDGQFRNSLLAKNNSDCIRIIYNDQLAPDVRSAPIEITNTTIADNNGSGLIYIDVPSGPIDISNSIFADNSEYGIKVDTSVLQPEYTIACSNFYGNGMGDYEEMENQTGSNDNISSDPYFCDAPADNYGLDICSSCIPENSGCGQLIGAFDLACSGTVHCGSIWYIATDGDDLNGTGAASNPFATIQKGIDAAAEGDTVLIAPGIYTGDGNRDLNPFGKGILITSSGGPAGTVIDAEASELDPHRGFIFENGEDSSTVIQGLTIRNCVVSGDSLGGAMWGHGTPSVAVTVKNNIIIDCGAGQGGGLFFQDNAGPTIINNTIIGNYALSGLDGGLWIDSGTVFNNIIRGNTPENFNAGLSIPEYNNIENGPTDNGNIDLDPLFIDQMNGDYGLQEGSPCINTGNPDPIYNDPDGTRNDIGALYHHLYIPPVLDSIGPKSIEENRPLEFTVSASDSNGTIPSLFTSELPPGADFTDNLDGTGLFSWTPAFDQLGPFEVTFYAADETDTVYEETQITVDPLPPFIADLQIEGITGNLHVIDNIPEFDWDYFDEASRPQSGFEIAVGSDNDWSIAELWEPNPFISEDTFVTYSGAPFIDGETYYLRVRSDNGLTRSEWFESSFRMNSAPSVPSIFGPLNDTIVMEAQPFLYGNISVDPEGDDLLYDFFYVNDTAFGPADTSLIENIAAVDDTAAVQIPAVLHDNWRYLWAIRSFDGFEYSAWSDTVSFFVNSDNQPPASFQVIVPPDSSGIPLYEMLPTLQWTASLEPDPGDSVFYTLIMSTDENFNFVHINDSIFETEFTLDDSLDFGTEYWWKVRANDSYGMTTFSDNIRYFRTWKLGDVNTDWTANLVDIIYLIDYKFKEGPEPIPLFTGDITGDCKINLIDILYLIDYKFKEGPLPHPGCLPVPSPTP